MPFCEKHQQQFNLICTTCAQDVDYRGRIVGGNHTSKAAASMSKPSVKSALHLYRTGTVLNNKAPTNADLRAFMKRAQEMYDGAVLFEFPHIVAEAYRMVDWAKHCLFARRSDKHGA